MSVRDPRDVLLAPVISEKSYGLIDSGQYTFIVLPEANKTQIKIAVEQAFTANGAFADEFIVSHGAQTAVGHDMGSGPIAPDEPVILNRPHAAARAARFFVETFPGRSLYAVKANPSPDLIEILWASGITHYDVASIAEVRLVRALLPEAVLCFMHPVKAEEAIREAYFVHGVRTFSLDSLEELDKIMHATEQATDLTLCVRLRVVPIVGFLLAGVLIGPNALGVVRDLEVVEAAAEVGVILLLFSIGIEFSLERLARIRRRHSQSSSSSASRSR